MDDEHDRARDRGGATHGGRHDCLLALRTCALGTFHGGEDAENDACVQSTESRDDRPKIAAFKPAMNGRSERTWSRGARFNEVNIEPRWLVSQRPPSCRDPSAARESTCKGDVVPDGPPQRRAFQVIVRLHFESYEVQLAIAEWRQYDFTVYLLVVPDDYELAPRIEWFMLGSNSLDEMVTRV